MLSNNKKILITGATGLIGTALLRYFITKGQKINILSRTPKSALVQGVDAFFWEPSENKIDTRCFEDVSVIIHLAGASINRKWTKSGKKLIFDSRINSSKLLLKEINKLPNHGIRRIICASGIGIYPSNATKLYSEDETSKSESYLHKLVYEWEKVNKRFESLGIDVTLFRIGLVLSQTGGIFPILSRLILNRFGLIFGTGRNVISWIYLDDLVKLILWSGIEKWTGAYNAVAPNPLSQKEMIMAVLQAKPQKTNWLKVPAWLIKLGIGERSELILSSQNVSAQKVLSRGFRFQCSDFDDFLKIWELHT